MRIVIFSTNYDGVLTGPGETISFTGALPAVQPILFGLRAYFTDNIGINFELSGGAPYLMGGGIAARF